MKSKIAWNWDNFWHVCKVACLTLFFLDIWFLGWVITVKVVTAFANHEVGALTGLVWAISTMMIGWGIASKNQHAQMSVEDQQQLRESESVGSLRVNPVIIKPGSNGNTSEQWRVVKGEDWVAYVNEDMDYLAYVPFDTEPEAKEFRDALVRATEI